MRRTCQSRPAVGFRKATLYRTRRLGNVCQHRTLNAPRSSSSGIAVGFSFDWPPVRKLAFDEPWVRPHLGRMAQLWGAMPKDLRGQISGLMRSNLCLSWDEDLIVEIK